MDLSTEFTMLRQDPTSSIDVDQILRPIQGIVAVWQLPVSVALVFAKNPNLFS